MLASLASMLLCEIRLFGGGMVQHLERRHTYRRFLFFAQAETNLNRDLFTLHAHNSSRQNGHKFCAERTQPEFVSAGAERRNIRCEQSQRRPQVFEVWATVTPHIITADEINHSTNRNSTAFMYGSMRKYLNFFFRRNVQKWYDTSVTC